MTWWPNFHEAQEETLLMLSKYQELLEEYLAVPVHTGMKTESEKFAGAQATYSIEALMRDGKALQAGTSHNLAQNFSKAFETKFTTENNEQDFVYQSSWGVSTRLIGAVIMGHHDEVGLVLPPRIAPYQVVIIPILKKNNDNSAVLNEAKKITEELSALGISYKLDDRDNIGPGLKFNEYEQKGVPIRLALGARDLENGLVEVHRRDTRSKDKEVKREAIAEYLKSLLETIQKDLLQRALDYRKEHTCIAQSIDDLTEILNTKTGFARAMWNGDVELEQILKDKFKASIRCIPDKTELDANQIPCILSGKCSQENKEILIARAY